MMIINMLTARYFQEDGKLICEWVAECRRNSDYLVKELQGDGKKERRSSIDRPILTLDCMSCYCHLLVTPSLNSSFFLLHTAIHSQTHFPSS